MSLLQRHWIDISCAANHCSPRHRPEGIGGRCTQDRPLCSWSPFSLTISEGHESWQDPMERAWLLAGMLLENVGVCVVHVEKRKSQPEFRLWVLSAHIEVAENSPVDP